MTNAYENQYNAFGQPQYGQILLVKVVEDHTGSFPVGVKCAYKCLVCVPVVSYAHGPVHNGSSNDASEGDTCRIQEPLKDDRYVIALNFRNNNIPKDTFHLAFLVAGVYVLDNQNAFLEAL